MYLPESSIITTKDGLHCQVYMNTHPKGVIIVKPKYIPTDKIHSDALPYRYISGRKMNRLNMWIDPKKLKAYIAQFKKAYPDYIFWSKDHNTWFFAVPKKRIEKVYDPREGLRDLMRMPEKNLDPHLKNVAHFVKLLQESGVLLKNLGITYSTLVGHYFLGVSDINLVVYGTDNIRRIMHFLSSVQDRRLRWKTDKEWLTYHAKRDRTLLMNEAEFLFHARRKKSEGFFNNNLFLIFGVEKPGEVKFAWGKEKYEPEGTRTVRGIVTSDSGAWLRPGYYTLAHGEIMGAREKTNKLPLKEVVFYSRNFMLQAKKGERIEARGLLEKVISKKGTPFYRLVLGYFDAYLTNRRDEEYIKTIRTR